MSKVVTIDRKGRLLLPKGIRKAAKLSAPGNLLVKVKSAGRVELFSVDSEMMKARRVAERKLANWREDDHEATRLVHRLAGVKKTETA